MLAESESPSDWVLAHLMQDIKQTKSHVNIIPWTIFIMSFLFVCFLFAYLFVFVLGPKENLV